MNVVAFAKLFEGNKLAYGGDNGKAIRCTRAEWLAALTNHLRGEWDAVGIYPLVWQEPRRGTFGQEFTEADIAQWWVHWGCVDFDVLSDHHVSFDYTTEEEAHTAALNLQRVLAAFGIVSWIERTRSHGRHVWIFCLDWTPASIVRNALLVASEIAETAVREVNPKTDGSNLEADQLGNYVRLPYPGTALGESRYVMIGGSALPLHCEIFVTEATANRTDRATLERVAGLYREPIADMVWETDAIDEYTGDVPRVVKYVIEHGPRDGDRSNGLVYVAHECMKAGLSPDAALALVGIADDAWGKYTGRRDRDLRLREIVERAWA